MYLHWGRKEGEGRDHPGRGHHVPQVGRGSNVGFFLFNFRNAQRNGLSARPLPFILELRSSADRPSAQRHKRHNKGHNEWHFGRDLYLHYDDRKDKQEFRRQGRAVSENRAGPGRPGLLPSDFALKNGTSIYQILMISEQCKNLSVCKGTPCTHF